MNKYAIAIHGGAGTILKNTMTPDKEKAYLNGLKNLSDEAVVIISKTKYYFSEYSGGLVIPEKLQKIVEEFKEKQPKKK